MREGNLKRTEITKTVKKDVLTNWERVKNDDAYCRNYIVNHYPEYDEALKTIAMKVGRSSKEYIAKARELVENHADSREISQYYDYGIFQELAQKHGVCSRVVKEVYDEAVLEVMGEIRFKIDFEDYVNKLVLPYESASLSEEEIRFAYLEADEFTDNEKRNFKETLEKIKAARIKALEALVEKTTYALATAYLNGQVRKNGDGEYTPEIRYYSENEDGGYILESHGGHHPAKMDLRDLLRHITYEINRHTHYLREYGDIYEHELTIYVKSAN